MYHHNTFQMDSSVSLVGGVTSLSSKGVYRGDLLTHAVCFYKFSKHACEELSLPPCGIW